MNKSGIPTDSSCKEPLAEIRNLKKYFPLGKRQIIKAVDDISLTIYKGETLGLVGESGCGKSTLGRTIIHLYEPTDGTVIFKGKTINRTLGLQERHSLTRNMQMIFQDPYSSLNPRMKVMDIVAEGLDAHQLLYGSDRRNRIIELLQTVGLLAEHAERFPHEFSGGQRQRIGIARALAVEPEFIIADEPISALDVSIQAQVINLLKELQEKLNLTYLFIAHDLSMVKHISDRIGVMYMGILAELAASEELFQHPLHPYTMALLSAAPIPDPDVERGRRKILLEANLPSLTDCREGCCFLSRCPEAGDICCHSKPKLTQIRPKHWVACHKAGKTVFSSMSYK